MTLLDKIRDGIVVVIAFLVWDVLFILYLASLAILYPVAVVGEYLQRRFSGNKVHDKEL